MCDSHDHGLTRRGLTGLALAGAASLILPGGVRAAQLTAKIDKAILDALCLMCIDYRLVTAGVDAFDLRSARAIPLPGPGQSKYDLVALAGASLAATSETRFLPTAAGFWQQFEAAWALHKIKKLVVLDHLGCGAYWVQFNKGNRIEPGDELNLHRQQMRRLKMILPEHARAVGAPADMKVDFWIFMDPDKPNLPPVQITNI